MNQSIKETVSMNEALECTDNERLLAQLDPSDGLRQALISLVGEPLTVAGVHADVTGGLNTKVYAFEAEDVSPTVLEELPDFLGVEPVRVFTDYCPDGEDDLYSEFSLFEAISGDGEVCAVTVRFDVGAHMIWVSVTVCVPSGPDRGSRAAISRAVGRLERKILAKAWRWFAEVAAECQVVSLGDVLAAEGLSQRDRAALGLVRLPDGDAGGVAGS